MNVPIAAERKLTHLDVARLRKLAPAGLPAEIDALLDEADVLDPRDIAPDVITMYTQFVVRQANTQRRQKLVLCYPADAEPAQGYISVLSPAGMSLLGLPVGATARWVAPDGAEHFAQVEEILFQPEATGDYLT
jgi:regulator of nucleoside diphosphate kinase